MRCLIANVVEPFAEFNRNLEDVVRERGLQPTFTQSLEEFLKVLQAEAEAYDLFFFDLSLIESLNEELRFRFERVRERLKRPFIAICYLPDENKELVLKLKVDQIICKYFDHQQIWYVLNHLMNRTFSAKRRWPRYLLDLPVEVANEGEQRQGESFDMGAGGLFVKTYEPFGRETRLKVRFRLPALDQLIDCRGRVVFSRSYNPLEKLMQPAGMGIEFLDIDEKLRQRIADFLINLYGFIQNG
jgi:uncharacterized protein (TIGR02266 family)